MSRFKSRIGRRVMAVLLSGAMVMSNMTVFAAEVSNDISTDTRGGYYEEAAEASPASETAVESVSETAEAATEAEAATTEAATTTTETTEAGTETETTEAGTETETTETGTEAETTETETTEAGTETETTEAETETEATEVETETEVTEADVQADSVASTQRKNADGKIDVYDFGAEQLDESIYNNQLTEGIINSWYTGVEPGSTSVNIASWRVLDAASNVLLEFNDGGFPTTHRLRSTNKNLTRWDDKSLEFGGILYTGYMYSNKGTTADVYLGVRADAGDILTFAASANTPANANTYTLESPSGEKITQNHTGGDNKGTVLTFYAKESGEYKIYTLTEKLVIARVTVEDTAEIPVTGTVTAPADLAAKEYSVVFTNKQSGAQTVAKVTAGKYTATLNEQYSYEVSLQDANGFIITKGTELSLAKGDGEAEHDITVESVNLVTVTGSITGLPEDVYAKLKLSFSSEKLFVPEPTFEGTNYSMQLEKDVEYTITAEGVNDYALKSDKISAADTATINIEFEKKPVYAITIDSEGATLAELANAEFVFTNLNEEGYVYTFTGPSAIELRDGVYSVEVKNCAPYTQKLTANLKVEGAAVTKKIRFSSEPRTEWNFAAGGEFATAGIDTTIQKKTDEFYGLQIDATNGKFAVRPGSGDVQVNKDTIVKIPVSGPTIVTVTAKSGNTQYTLGGEAATAEVTNYTYTASEPGFVEFVSTAVKDDGKSGSTYLLSIKLTIVHTYKEKLTVGATGCDFTTISEAVKEAAAMDRPNNERVIIEIQPGNYEEMLVIDTPNITLKNANANPSIVPTNKGVDIEATSVRITSYYGHGYTYFSMGNDCKYDPEILAVNKENGYASFENPGSGTTAGSYWNATVSINANGFEADGIIFENSFNQYVSAKAADDVIVPQTSAKEGAVPRAEMAQGDTTVQQKEYVERAAALAIYNNCKQLSFNNCSFIGRQDTLYGGTGVTAAFYDCDVYGGTDYIFGGMTAVFAKCDLVFNTNDQTDSGKKNDVGYITAAQQSSGRGYLMYNCTVTSTKPGVNTASENISKPGYFGRPWSGKNSEVVFYNTIVEQAANKGSLIEAVGWLSTLGGTSDNVYEYGTYEMVEGIDNSSNRAAWSMVIAEPKFKDGTDITVAAFLGDWDAFAGKNMDIVIPTTKVEGITVSNIEAQAYTGSEITPAVVVKDGSKELASGTDYTVAYSNNVNAYLRANAAYASKTAPTVTITMTEGGAKFTKTFDITPVALTDERIKVSASSVIANKQEQKVVPVVIFGDKELELDKDYTVTYTSEGDYTAAGTYNVTVTAVAGGNFTGEVQTSYDIVPEDGGSKTWLTKAKITLPKGVKYSYTGKAHRPIPASVKVGTEELTYGKDYTVQYMNNVSAGKATVTIVGAGGYIGTKSQTFTIAKANIKKEAELSYTKKDLQYTGSGNMLKDLRVVLTSSDFALTANTDYTVTYKYDTKKSTDNVTVTVKAIGTNCSGSISEKFTASPIDLAKAKTDGTLTYDAEMKFSNKGAKVSGLAVGDYKLTEGVDYKVKYKNNKKMDDTPEVTITGINGCTGKDIALTGLSIAPTSLKDVTVIAPVFDVAKVKAKNGIYNCAVKLTVTDYAGAKLKENKDYKVDWAPAQSEFPFTRGNTITVEITPADNAGYTGKQKITYRVAENLKKVNVTVNKDKPLVSGGVVLEAADFTGLTLDKDFVITGYKNNLKKGNATVTIEGIGEYYGTKTVKFKIVE